MPGRSFGQFDLLLYRLQGLLITDLGTFQQALQSLAVIEPDLHGVLVNSHDDSAVEFRDIEGCAQRADRERFCSENSLMLRNGQTGHIFAAFQPENLV